MYLFNKSNNERRALKRHNKIIVIEKLYQQLLEKLTRESDKDFLSNLFSIIFSYSPKSNEETNENIEKLTKITEILETITSIIDNTFVFEENQLKTSRLGINSNQVSSKKLLENDDYVLEKDDYVLVTNNINDMLTKGIRGKVREKKNNVREKLTSGYIIDFNQPYNPPLQYKNEMHYKSRHIGLDTSVKYLQKISGPFKTFFFWKLLYNQLSPLKYNEEILSDTNINVKLNAKCIQKNLYQYNNKGLIFKCFKFDENLNKLYNFKFEQERYINTYLANQANTPYDYAINFVVNYYGEKITDDGIFLIFENLANGNFYN